MLCGKVFIPCSSLILLACGSPGAEFDFAAADGGSPVAEDLQMPQEEADASSDVARGSIDEYGTVVAEKTADQEAPDLGGQEEVVEAVEHDQKVDIVNSQEEEEQVVLQEDNPTTNPERVQEETGQPLMPQETKEDGLDKALGESSPPRGAPDHVARAEVDLPGVVIEETPSTIEKPSLPLEAKKKSEVADQPSSPPEADSTIRYEDVVTLSQVVDVCNTVPTNTLTRTVRFESNRQEPKESWECEYTASDVNNRLRHYAVHSQEIPLPGNGVLCDLEFVQKEQNFYYDDHMFFLFNDLILMSSYNYGPSRKLEKYKQFYKFDWDKLFNASQHDNKKYKPYCVLGGRSCQLPKTQKEGKTVMEFLHNKTISQKLFLYGKEEERFDLSVVVTGDDNSKVDCRHSDLSLETTVTYVVLD